MALADRFTIEPIWKGRTAIVVAPGPSLSTAQTRAIAIARHQAGSNFRVMAINDAVFACWFADWHHAGDWNWWNWNIQSCHSFKGIKTTLASDVPRTWVDGYIEPAGNRGFTDDPGKCFTGASSGYQGIHMSAQAGAKRIILVGFDMHGDHFFGLHPDKIRTDYQSQMLPAFPVLKEALDARGIEVINATPGSSLIIFPYTDLADALSR